VPETTPRTGDRPRTLAEHAEAKAPGLVREFVDFLRHNKKWWLIPILVVLLLAGLIIVFGASSPLAPFIYTLF